MLLCVNPIWGGTKTGAHTNYSELKYKLSHQDGTLPLATGRNKEEFIFNLTFNLRSGFENQTGSDFSLRSNMSDCFFFTIMYFWTYRIVCFFVTYFILRMKYQCEPQFWNKKQTDPLLLFVIRSIKKKTKTVWPAFRNDQVDDVTFSKVHASGIKNVSHHQGLCFLFSKSWPSTFSPFWLQSISLFGSRRRHLSVTLFLSCLKTTENGGYLIFRALSDVHLNLPDGMSSLPLLAFLSTRRGGQKETRWSKGLWWVLQIRLVWSSSSPEGGVGALRSLYLTAERGIELSFN